VLLESSAHPGRCVRLGYCLNLHPAEDLDGLLEGLRGVAAPVRGHLLAASEDGALAGAFGVGPWVPAALAAELARPGPARERFLGTLEDLRLDAFTWNAFPFGGFHAPGLKRGVFRPSWREHDRLAFTLDVARLAAAAHERALAPSPHVSISTHAGGFGTDLADERARLEAGDGLARCCVELARIESDGGPRIVLSLEPEPRSSSNDTAELAAFRALVLERAPERLAAEFGADTVAAALARHLGACLDACHAAVEFEEPANAVANVTAHGAPLGKLQFSSALRLEAPDTDDAGRAALLAMAEPVYLHQVTGRRTGPSGAELLRSADLPEVAANPTSWRGCDEWRCHFHVPVDLADLGVGGLATTRPEADAVLAELLADPGRWGTDELHVEIETYTWSVLPEAVAGGPGALVDGLVREYEHVLARLAAAGWIRS
jgi:hypothetical protein